jgi:hypothetical protein
MWSSWVLNLLVHHITSRLYKVKLLPWTFTADAPGYDATLVTAPPPPPKVHGMLTVLVFCAVQRTALVKCSAWKSLHMSAMMLHCARGWDSPIDRTQPSRTSVERCRVQLKCDGTRWRTQGEVKGELTNGVGSQYSSHYLGTWCIQHYYRWCTHLGCQ